MQAPRILIAPGPYKECLSSRNVAEAMRVGIQDVLPRAQLRVLPLCDGGTGLASVLVERTKGQMIQTVVCGPLGDEIQSAYGLLGDGKTAVIESACAAGLSLVPLERRNPLETSTFGVGQLILAARRAGATEIIVGCGDSGTSDCGIGCAAAMGIIFYDSDAMSAITFPRAQDLSAIKLIQSAPAQPLFAGCRITVACNLSSVLLGPDSTCIVYGPQKGATPSQVKQLYRMTETFVSLVKASEGVDLSFIPGAGGSGGLAASLYAFFGARLMYSFDVVDHYCSLDSALQDADMVITGEGMIDDRTATGKVVCGVSLRAKKYNIPVIAIVGSIADDYEDVYFNGVDAVECIAHGPASLSALMTHAPKLIADAAGRAVRFAYKLPRRESS